MKYQQRWTGFTLIVAALTSTLFVCTAKAECPLESALDYYTARELVWTDATLRGETQVAIQEALQAVSWEVYAQMPESCHKEMNVAQTAENSECQGLVYDAKNRISAYQTNANALYRQTRDKQGYIANTRANLRVLLSSLPHACWFYEGRAPQSAEAQAGCSLQEQQLIRSYSEKSLVAASQGNFQGTLMLIQELQNALSPACAAAQAKANTPGQPDNCQAIENNYRACKQKSEDALKKCAVWPGPGPCPNRGPLCTLPSSYNPSCSP